MPRVCCVSFFSRFGPQRDRPPGVQIVYSSSPVPWQFPISKKQNVSSSFTPEDAVLWGFSLTKRTVACSASDSQDSNFESCLRRAVSSNSFHHPQEILLVQLTKYVHKSGPNPIHSLILSLIHPFPRFLSSCCKLQGPRSETISKFKFIVKAIYRYHKKTTGRSKDLHNVVGTQ